MKVVVSILQIAVALSLLNVWLLRFRQSTPYRGGGAHSMIEEFAAYGLPAWSTYVVGVLKVGAAVCLIAGLWYHPVVFPASLVIAVLMVGALAMHLKVKDPLMKSLPAVTLLVLSGIICVAAIR